MQSRPSFVFKMIGGPSEAEDDEIVRWCVYFVVKGATQVTAAFARCSATPAALLYYRNPYNTRYVHAIVAVVLCVCYS